MVWQGGSKEVISLSIEETNKLRASLGLKPLNITDKDKPQNEEEEENLVSERYLSSYKW